MSSSIHHRSFKEPSYSSNTTSSSPSSGEPLSQEQIPSFQNAFLNQTLRYIQGGLFPDAIDALFRLVAFASEGDAESDLEKTYHCIFILIEHFTSENLLSFEKEGVLDAFLSASKKMHENQAKLCYLLGEKHEKSAKLTIDQKLRSNSDYTLYDLIKEYDLTLLYYSKTISIHSVARNQDVRLLDDVYQGISQIFFEIIKNRLQESFAKAVRELNIQKFKETLDELEHLKGFFTSKSQIESIYTIGADTIARIPTPESREKFKESFGYINDKIRALHTQNIDISPFNTTRDYRDSHAKFRQNFNQDIKDVRGFQKNLIKEFILFFQEVFIKDTLAIMGPPPCSYDVRAIGSTCKEEICPYSDLEYFILIENDKPVSKEYFKNFAEILRFQLILLDETPDLTVVFKCLHSKNFSGLKVDAGGNPARHAHLIGTPSQMVQVIKPQLIQPSDIDNTILKSVSLMCSDSSLFLNYQQKLDERLNEVDASVLGSLPARKQIGLKLIKERLRDYRLFTQENTQLFQKPVNIKEGFIELIAHLLRDVSIYFECNEANTIDIVDALVAKKVLTFLSGSILKEALSNLYIIRIRLHKEAKEQNEMWEEFRGMNPLILKEKRALEKIHSLVLYPLYLYVQRALENEELFESVFQNIDLIQEGFEGLSQQSFRSHFAPFVMYAVSVLVQNNAQESLHENFYRRLSSLSGTEALREIYLDILERQNELLADTLADIPSLDGYRQTYLRKEKTLQRAIEAITTDEKTTVQIEWGSRNRPRFLKREYFKILDPKGDIKNAYPKSAHHVAKIEGPNGLHFKQLPANPLMEYAMGNLYARIDGFLTPAVEMACFTVHTKTEIKRYPVIISQTVEGQSLKDFFALNLNSDSLSQPLDWDRWSFMLLCSILTLPGDGRLSNYIVDKNGGIWCVDNDISFADPLVQEWPQGKKINFCSALFCVFQARPLSKEALERFCSYDPGSLLNGWLLDVIKKDAQCQRLSSQEEKKEWLELENSSKSTILLREGTVATLNLQFWRLQSYIRICLANNYRITPIDLLGQIVSLRKNMTLENPTGRYILSQYQKKAKQGTIDQALSKIVARSVEQSLTSFQSDKACLDKPPTHAEITGRSLFSPEKARSELLTAMFSQVFSENFEPVYTGYRNKTEVLQGSFKDLPESRQIIVLSSLGQITALSLLKPKVVVLHHCDVLDSTNLSFFLHKDLEYLDLRFCKKIQGSAFELIALSCPHLKELHVMNCPELENVRGGVIFSTTIVFSELEVLRISNCEHLRNIYIEAPLLKSYILKNNPNLSWIDCAHIPVNKVIFGWSNRLTKHVLKEFLKQYSNTHLKLVSSSLALGDLWTALVKNKDDDLFMEKFEFLANNGFVFNGKEQFRGVIDAIWELERADIFPKIIEHYPEIIQYKKLVGKILIGAVRRNELGTIKFILSKRFHFNTQIEWETIAVTTAMQYGDLFLLQTLLEDGALIEIGNVIDESLYICIHLEREDFLELFLKKLKESNAQNVEEIMGRALFATLRLERRSSEVQLLKHAKDLKVARVEKILAASIVVAIRAEDRNIIRALLKRSEYLNSGVNWAELPLLKATKAGYLWLVRTLVQENRTTRIKGTLFKALKIALELNKPHTVIFLVDEIIELNKSMEQALEQSTDAQSLEEKTREPFLWNSAVINILKHTGNYFFVNNDFINYQKIVTLLLNNEGMNGDYGVKEWSASNSLKKTKKKGNLEPVPLKMPSEIFY